MLNSILSISVSVIAVSLSVLFPPLAHAQFPVKAQTVETIHANNSFLFDSESQGLSLLTKMANSLIPISNRNLLLRLDVQFQGIPSRDAAINQVMDEVQSIFREAKILNLQDSYLVLSEASVILSSIAPHLNATRHRALVDSIQDWFDSKPHERAVLRVQPNSSFSKHALVLVSLEGERAQGLIVYIPERY